MKLAFITGGSRGLGRSLVSTFLAGQYTVIEFSRSGNSDCNVPCDFSAPHQALQIIEKQFRKFSAKTLSEIVLVNNAGTIQPIGPLRNSQPNAWITSISINLLAAITASGLFIRYFQDHDCPKMIVNISSGAAHRPVYGWSLYCAAKAGLEQFTTTVALEQAREKFPIRVLWADPGIMDTKMQAAIRAADEENFPDKADFVALKENNQLRSPDFVAEYIYQQMLSLPEDKTRISVYDLGRSHR